MPHLRHVQERRGSAGVRQGGGGELVYIRALNDAARVLLAGAAGGAAGEGLQRAAVVLAEAEARLSAAAARLPALEYGDEWRYTQLLLMVGDLLHGDRRQLNARLVDLCALRLHPPAAEEELSQATLVYLFLSCLSAFATAAGGEAGVAAEQGRQCLAALRAFRTPPQYDAAAARLHVFCALLSPQECPLLPDVVSRRPALRRVLKKAAGQQQAVLRQLLLSGFCRFSTGEKEDSEPQADPRIAPKRLLLVPEAGTTFCAVAQHLSQGGWAVDTVQGGWEPPRHALQGLLASHSVLLFEKRSAEKAVLDWAQLQERSGRVARRQHRVLINYYVGAKAITLKQRMALLLRRVSGAHVWLPETFVLRHGGGDERVEFQAAWRRSAQAGAHWILKPSSGSKGDGIRISDSYAALLARVDVPGGHAEPPWVVQRYVSSPYLIDGRKFDIRSWVLLAPDLSIYVSRQGVLRTASSRYSIRDIHDLGHLTNHSIQETGPEFGTFEKGNEMWYGEFQAYLDRTTGGSVSFNEVIVPQMDAVTVEVLQAVRGQLTAPPEPLQCFQLFGFDFLLDRSLHVWLLEVNGSPMIAEQLRDRMVADMLELLLSPEGPSTGNQFHCIYPPKTR